jgi:nitrogen fixation protein NifU and related proteins
MYSEKVMDHFRNPRNVGEIADADGIGEIGNPVCGDMMTFYIKVKDNRLIDVKFKTFGCGAAIAVSSMVSEMAIGKTLEEAKKITNADVAKELGGLPPNKLHCSNLGADALHRAIENYLNKQKTQAQSAPEAKKPEAQACVCPYCKQPVAPKEPYCKPCNVKLQKCPHCQSMIAQTAKVCPKCAKAL